MKPKAMNQLLGGCARLALAWAAIALLTATLLPAAERLPPTNSLPSAASLPSAVSSPAAPPNAQRGYVWKDPDGSPLPFQSEEEIVEFLRTAGIESINDIPLGVTNPRQVVLENNGVRMRAALRDYDETFTRADIAGDFYPRLRDSFVFDVPAFEMAKLLGLANIPPVAFRRIGGQRVSLQIWLEGGLMETDRVAQGLSPPSFQRYREQTDNMRVFDSIIGNVDRNTGNILTDEDGDFWLIDHSRSFMRNDETRYLDRISMCGRVLFARIKTLTREELLPLMSPPLTSSEIDWTLRRRDKVVAHIEGLIATRGGDESVLFDDRR